MSELYDNFNYDYYNSAQLQKSYQHDHHQIVNVHFIIKFNLSS